MLIERQVVSAERNVVAQEHGAAATGGFDKTGERAELIKLPDERHGVLFVFEVYERVSYALIISVKDPVTVGDRFTQP